MWAGGGTIPTLSLLGEELQFFVEPVPLFEAMLSDIRRATKRLWLETYIYANDEIGQRFAEALKERARAGVDVRLLYDAIGSLDVYSSFFAKMQGAGVQVVRFHSVGEALYRIAPLRILNRRNHRKLLIVDDDIAYFGGMNIVAPHLVSRDERLGRFTSLSGWRDLHVRLRGRKQSELVESFERSWLHAQGQRSASRSAAYRKGLPPVNAGIHFFDSGPGRRFSRSGRIFTNLVNLARRELIFSMAYFLPVGGVWRALQRAVKRGVKITVVLPGMSDVRLMQHASTYLYHRLLRMGVSIFERQQVMLHSKVMIVDGEWSVLGSSNLDARSLWINLELLAVIRSPDVAAVLRQVVEEERRGSQQVTAESLRIRSWWERSLDRMAWSLRWWL